MEAAGREGAPADIYPLLSLEQEAAQCDRGWWNTSAKRGMVRGLCAALRIRQMQSPS